MLVLLHRGSAVKAGAAAAVAVAAAVLEEEQAVAVGSSKRLLCMGVLSSELVEPLCR